MNWFWLRRWPWLDTPARFVARVPRNGLFAAAHVHWLGWSARLIARGTA